MFTIKKSTIVTYPQRKTSGVSKIISIKEYLNQSVLIITEETPFHPVDHTWADQPPDEGIIIIDSLRLEIKNVVDGAVNLDSQDFFLTDEIPVKRGSQGWASLVVHIVDLPFQCSVNDFLGKTAFLEVDEDYRKKISASHSACHLSAFALNKCASDLWRKEVRKDSLGNFNLDQLAIQSSKIKSAESIDHYRLGKSLRKQGFDCATFLDRLKNVESCVNEQLEEWLKMSSEIVIEADEPYLDSLRWWSCGLPDGLARMPCGGSHLSDLIEYQSIKVSYEALLGVPEILIHTIPQLKG